MALTKEEHDNILKKLSETGGFTPDMLDEIQRLRDEFDEREGELKRYHEQYDGEDKEDWKSKYTELEKKYRERFWNATKDKDGETPLEHAKNDLAEDKRETREEEKHIEDLFKRREDKDE